MTRAARGEDRPGIKTVGRDIAGLPWAVTTPEVYASRPRLANEPRPRTPSGSAVCGLHSLDFGFQRLDPLLHLAEAAPRILHALPDLGATLLALPAHLLRPRTTRAIRSRTATVPIPVVGLRPALAARGSRVVDPEFELDLRQPLDDLVEPAHRMVESRGRPTVAVHVVRRRPVMMVAVVRPVMMAGTAPFPPRAVPRIITVLVGNRERVLMLIRRLDAACRGDRHLPGKHLHTGNQLVPIRVGDGPVQTSGEERHEQHAADGAQYQREATHGKPPLGPETNAGKNRQAWKKPGSRGGWSPPSVSFHAMNGPAPERFRDPALVDFGLDARGRGRRLERLGGLLVDRPLPQTRERRGRPEVWQGTAALFRETAADAGGPTAASADARGDWEFHAAIPSPWHVRVPLDGQAIVLEVRPAASGQIGVFLEQVEQWRWLARSTVAGSRMLSLFGHSGAATLAMAAAGAEVVHVDASRQAIGLARRNAAASGLADRPIRWICENAATFVAREARRGSTYAGVVLDPPSWGHGPRGQPFAIDADLVPLVRATLGLVATAPAGPILLTCHSPGWSHDRLRDTLAAACSAAGRPTPVLEIGRLTCRDDTGRELDLGCFARCHPDTTQRCIP